ncbi:unnamed protein product [Clavelina lepadiformis]|uniref:NF-kappa-B essential modulator NEMO CC2-LZ domain-containing protein n=1 Tax=Clavelina lepadiformis TaxID=159417 RepID=A0ABP0FXW2_CLALP
METVFSVDQSETSPDRRKRRSLDVKNSLEDSGYPSKILEQDKTLQDFSTSLPDKPVRSLESEADWEVVENNSIPHQQIASLPVVSARKEFIKSAVGPHDIDRLKKDNNKLRMKVKYMENLGVLVTDFKQENQHLAQENVMLRKQLEELQATTPKSKPFPSRKGLENFEKTHLTSLTESVDRTLDNTPLPLSSNRADVFGTSNDIPTTSSSTDPAPTSSELNACDEITSALPVTNEDNKERSGIATEDVGVAAVGEASATRSETDCRESPKTTKVTSSCTDVAITSHHVDEGNLSESVENENNSFNKQIQQLEEMVGVRDSNGSINNVSVNNSMTSQFAKIAAVFASLSQRVVQSQKKARNKQAFCDALMAENQKTKRELQACHQEIEALQKENERLKEKSLSPSAQPSTSSVPVAKVTEIKQTASTSADTSSSTNESVVIKLQARVKKLEAQRAEILRVNKAWDTQYKCLKQELDRRTRETDNAERSQESPENDVGHHDRRRRRDLEALLASAKREINSHIQEKSELARNFASAHAQCQSLKREVAHLRESQRKLKSDKSCLQAENQRLNQALEAAYCIQERRSVSIRSDEMPLLGRSDRNGAPPCDGYSPPSSDPYFHHENTQENSGPPASEDDLRTQIEVLQEQVKIYREDFETERRDREKCQGEKQRLDELLTRARHEVQALSQQVRTNEQDFRQERRDKEHVQRQLQRYQSNSRDGTNVRTRDRYGGDVNDPPAYYAHRFTGNEDTVNGFNRASTRRRSRPPQYQAGRANRPDWYPSENVDNEAILSYPPGELLEETQY